MQHRAPADTAEEAQLRQRYPLPVVRTLTALERDAPHFSAFAAKHLNRDHVQDLISVQAFSQVALTLRNMYRYVVLITLCLLLLWSLRVEGLLYTLPVCGSRLARSVWKELLFISCAICMVCMHAPLGLRVSNTGKSS